MIELNLVPDEWGNNDLEQIFPNGFVRFSLRKTPTSEVFNNCYVEIGADKVGNWYRLFDSQTFRTEKAFERARIWVNDILNDNEHLFMKIK